MTLRIDVAPRFRLRSTLQQILEASAPRQMAIDTKPPKLPSPSRDGRPMRGSSACVSCKILVAPNSRPLECQI